MPGDVALAAGREELDLREAVRPSGRALVPRPGRLIGTSISAHVEAHNGVAIYSRSPAASRARCLVG